MIIILIVVKRIAALLCDKKIIDKEDIEVYEYGLQLLISSFLEIVNVLIVSALLGLVNTGIMYLICIITIRVYTGGYHADTYFRCNIVFIALYLLSVCMWKEALKYSHIWLYLLILLLLSFVYVICKAPVSNHNKPLSEQERKSNKRKSVIIFAVLTCLLIVVYIKDSILYEAGLYINIVLIIIVIMMFVGIVKERMRENIVYGTGKEEK